MPLILLRLLPYILAVLAVAAILFFAYDTGRKYERGVWAQRELQLNQDIEKQRHAAEKRIRDLEEHRQVELAEVQNAHLKNIANLNNTINSLSSRGLYITASTCPDDRVPNGRTGEGSGGPPTGHSNQSKIRLPDEITSGLWDVIRAAEEVKDLYLACRRIVTSSACNIEFIN